MIADNNHDIDSLINMKYSNVLSTILATFQVNHFAFALQTNSTFLLHKDRQKLGDNEISGSNENIFLPRFRLISWRYLFLSVLLLAFFSIDLS